MGKVLWKTAVLFGAILCLSLFHDGAIAETPVPEKGVTLVLRAPTSEQSRLVKISHVDGERKEEVIAGFEVELPKNTPVFFIVDQVNTVLYSVEISAEEEKSMEQTVPEFLRKFLEGDNAFAWIEVAKTALEGKRFESNLAPMETKAKKTLEDLESKVQAVEKFNKELKEILSRSEEEPQFYSHGAAGFEQIRIDAKTAAKKMLDSSRGTSQEIREDAAAAIAAVHTAYEEMGKKAPGYVPKDLSDASNKIAEPFLNAAENLQAIEKATWYKEDTQFRRLQNKITYTINAVAPKMDGNKPPSSSKITRRVTVKGAERWIIKSTVGAFVSRLRDKSYLLKEVVMNGSTSSDANGGMSAPTATNVPENVDTNATDATGEGANTTMVNANAEIKRKIVPGGIEDKVTTSPGVLVHLSHTRFKWLGLSGGVGIDGAKNPQVSLGLSFLFNRHDGQALALTFGGITGRVKDLDGYVEGDFFKGAGPLPTKLVTKISWFGALTYNFKFDSILGPGQSGNSTN